MSKKINAQEDRFEELKAAILCRMSKSCSSDNLFESVRKATETGELMQVIKDNFKQAAFDLLIPGMMIHFKKEFNAHDIYLDESTDRGYVLCGGRSRIDRIGGNAKAVIKNGALIGYVMGNAEIYSVCDEAIICCVEGNATIHCLEGNAAIWRVCKSATIRYVKDSATIREVDDSATIRDINGKATVNCVKGNAMVQHVMGRVIIRSVKNNAMVCHAGGSAYVQSDLPIECKLIGNAIHRISISDMIRYANDTMKFEKVENRSE